MAGKKLYTSLVLEDDFIKVARIEVSGKKASLVKLDKIKLVNTLERDTSSEPVDDGIFDAFDTELEDESIFGIEEDTDDEIEFDTDTDDDDDLDLDLDLGIDEGDEDNDFGDITDMADADGDDGAASNELLLYNLLSDIDPKKVKLSINVPFGSAFVQILKDVDFKKTKKKDLQIIIDDRLESLYGAPKGKDYYSYVVREDGSLVLVSIEDEAPLLSLLNNTENIYSGKVFVNEVQPDEAVLIGLYRANYEIEDGTITALIQYGEKSCRIVFMQGKELMILSSVIPEGTSSRKFLNTLFSKILFQLDTGEVPNLDRIILCNNSLGEESIEFFESRFPDIEVTDFQFDEEKFDYENFDHSTVSTFTSAIGVAWADANFEQEYFPQISFVPEYIKERQKIFKLQWHGYVLLALILAVFPISNYFYLKNSVEIETLNASVSSTKAQIASMESTVQNYNRINAELSGIQSQLELLDALSGETLKWTVNLDLINRGIDNIDSIWFTSLVVDESTGNVELSGYSLYRNRIPMVADIFSSAVLVDVTRTLIREKEVYAFTYSISKVVPNEDVYTPESAQGLKEILGGAQ
ncbi:hypothetical protein [Balneola vulgaris]|uniref:hypothetical protein n=1 Tax=Balneola vulgaris TaxID=287535 RepID=UPI00036223BD|nr:hypothetical protein [Balneola vulgaris]